MKRDKANSVGNSCEVCLTASSQGIHPSARYVFMPSTTVLFAISCFFRYSYQLHVYLAIFRRNTTISFSYF